RGGRRGARHDSTRSARPRPSRAARAALGTHERNGGDTVNDLTPELAGLGDALARAAAADLARAPRRRARRRLAVAAAAAVVALPGIAFAADRLVGGDEVAASMPAGTLALAGTEPTCTVVSQDVEYHCVLARPPAPELSDWKGTVEPTVDRTKHVNGGCRSLAGDGLEGKCYLGDAAAGQAIVSAGCVGADAP